jgi:feruloyl-CoA synthase
MTTPMAARRVRPVRIAPVDAVVRRGDGGVVYMQSPHPLGPYDTRITDSLDRWAVEAPGRVFLAQREAGPAGDWIHLTYGDAHRRVRNIGQALLSRRLSIDRPVLILSGNGIDHALLALAAMYVGIPYAPIAPPYSLQSKDFATLRFIVDRLRPGLVFAADGGQYRTALAHVAETGAEIVVSVSPPEGLATTRFAELEATPAGEAVAEAMSRVGPDTLAKILFTSGSTGHPKGVINTQRMLCSNQAMIRSVMQFLGDEPPVLCDWSPWNHTAGGNHNFGLALTNGGTLYIDEGKPTPALFAATLRNLREVACTAHFAIPRTYELLMPHLRTDPVLRATFFSRLKLLFYAAAGLGQRFWDELRDISIDATGEEILIMTGLGSTETAPFAFSTGAEGAFSGMIGLPAPGLALKLAPVGEKLEARVRGPNVTPGYLADEELTRNAFDDEGYYRLGDAMRFVDAADPRQGLIFDGRLAEDFKLSTGTWVSVGPLRTRILQQAAGYVQDVVITGHDRAMVAALIFPNLPACRELAGLPPDAAPHLVARHPRVVDHVRHALDELARRSTGSSTFVARAILLDEPPSLDARETTDKGSLNQKAVLQNRAALVDELYAPDPPAYVIIIT